jgi:mono/diheme cytochrome c family protein
MSYKNLTFLTLIFLISLFLLSACNLSLAQDVPPPPGYVPPTPRPDPAEVLGDLFPADKPDPFLGALVYSESCAQCHGETGLADNPQAASLPVPQLANPTFARQSTPQDWYGVVSLGNLEKFMPGFLEDYSSEERWAAIAYIYSLSTSVEELKHGQELYEQNCAACHSKDGTGEIPEAPDFTDQSRMTELSQVALFSFIANGVGDKMPGFSGLNEEEIWALAAYLRSFTLTTLEEQQELLTYDLSETLSTQETDLEKQPSDPPESERVVEQQEEQGTIVTGSVLNESSGEVPPDLEVTLRTFRGMDELFTTSTLIAPDKSFRFDNLELDPDIILVVTADYQNMTFASDFTVVTQDQSTYDLPLTIYETTSDSSVLSIDSFHLFFDFSSPDIVHVVQFYSISNPSDLVVIPASDNQPALTFPLAPGYSNLTFEQGEIGNPYLLTEAGFGETRAIMPGLTGYQVLFSYDLPYDKGLSLIQRFPASARVVNIFIPEKGIKLDNQFLRAAGIQSFDDQSYQMYTGTDEFASGSEILLELSGKHPANRIQLFRNSSNTNLILIIAGIVLILTAAVWWIIQYVKEKRRDDEELFILEILSDDHAAQEEIMDAIIILDDRFEAGKLDQTTYTRQRSELKDRLMRLVTE